MTTSRQIQNWENASLIVVRSDRDDGPISGDDFADGLGENEVDWEATYPCPTAPDSMQAAWEESVLDESDDATTMAFFMHYIEPSKPLWFRRIPLALPESTPMPASLRESAQYTAP